jgi:hypothetical protein
MKFVLLFHVFLASALAFDCANIATMDLCTYLNNSGCAWSSSTMQCQGSYISSCSASYCAYLDSDYQSNDTDGSFLRPYPDIDSLLAKWNKTPQIEMIFINNRPSKSFRLRSKYLFTQPISIVMR